jgi:hypothetical protein
MQSGEMLSTFELLASQPTATPPTNSGSGGSHETNSEGETPRRQEVSREFTALEDGMVTVFVNSPLQGNPELIYPIYSIEVRVTLEDIAPGEEE